MQKVIQIKRSGDPEVRTLRVFATVPNHPQLNAVVEAAVLEAINAWRGPGNERVVHVCDGRNSPTRSPDAPLPGTLTRRDPPPVDDLPQDGDDEEGDFVL